MSYHSALKHCKNLPLVAHLKEEESHSPFAQLFGLKLLFALHKKTNVSFLLDSGSIPNLLREDIAKLHYPFEWNARIRSKTRLSGAKTRVLHQFC